MKGFSPFSSIYPRLLQYIFKEGVKERNKRTGKIVLAVPGPSFTIVDASNGWLPVDGFRKQYPGTAAAEIAWFLSGSTDVKDLHHLNCHIWDKFVEPGTDWVVGAYGYRWRSHFDRDQIDLALKTLTKDPSSRQVFVSAWDPAHDGLGEVGTNFPCPIGFTLNLIGGKLNMSVLLRSSDVFVGLPYDVMGHAVLLAVLGRSLGVPPGLMTFTLAHAHLYDVHFDMASEGLKTVPKPGEAPQVRLSDWDMEWVLKKPELFVQQYRDKAKQVTWPEFNPHPEVVQ